MHSRIVTDGIRSLDMTSVGERVAPLTTSDQRAPSPPSSPVAGLVVGLGRRGARHRRLQPLHRPRDRPAARRAGGASASATVSIRCRSSGFSRTCRPSPARCATCSIGTEPYPMTAWANTFARLRIDLEQAFVRERELAPVGRPAAERAQLDDANRRFWETHGSRVRAARRRATKRAPARPRSRRGHARGTPSS